MNLNAIKRKLGNLAGGVVSSVKSAIPKTQNAIVNWATKNPQQALKIINAPQQIKQQAIGTYRGFTEPTRIIPPTEKKTAAETIARGIAMMPPSVTFGVPQMAGGLATKIPQAISFLSKTAKEIPFYTAVSRGAEETTRKGPLGKVPYLPEAAGFIAPFFIGGVGPKGGVSSKAILEAEQLVKSKTTPKNIAMELLESVKKPPVEGGVIEGGVVPNVFQKDLERFTALVKQNEKYGQGVPSIGKLPSSQAVADQMGITHEELMNQVLTKAGKPLPQVLPKTPEGVIPPVPVSPPPPETPVNKLIQALKPLRQIQESLYTAERGKRIGEFTKVGETVSGEKGFYEQLTKLKGQLPKVQFETLRKTLKQPTIDSLFNQVKTSHILTDWEKVTANNALAKMFGKEGTALPTKNELSLLSDVFGEEFTKAVLDKRPLMEKVMGTIGDVLSIPRSLLAGGLDMSFGLKQGIFGAYRHPKQWASAFKEQFKYFFSEKAVNELNESIIKSPNYQMMRENKLSIMNLGDILTKREEQFRSSLAEKIPIIGKFVRASARAYTGFANKMRADVFNKMVEVGKKTGDIKNPKYLKDMAKFINAMTGRGTLGLLEKVGTEITSTLFSPRLLASRIQLLNPLYYIKLQPAVRKEALKTLFAFVAGSATLLELGKLGGFEVVTDPTNSDFLKLKKGNTRIDILAGFQQPVVLIARLLKQELTSSTTGKKIKFGEGYKPLTSYDLINTYFENKTAPVMSFFLNWSKGTSFEGQPFEVKQEIIKRLIPMFIQDMAELYKDDPSSIPFGIPAFFGAGLQTYGGTEKNNLDTMKVQYEEGKPIKEEVLSKVPDKEKAELLYSEFKKAVKNEDKEALAKIKNSGLVTPETKKLFQAYQVLEKAGIMKADREIAALREEEKAEAVLKRLDSFVPKNKGKHLLLLLKFKIITPETLAEMKRLQGK